MAKTNKILPYIIIGIPVLIGGFFLYKYIKGRKKGEDAPDNYDKSNDVKIEKTETGGSGSASTKYFPLKKGSKGGKVKELQEAILKYDSKLLPKFGADSDFGSETQNAVKTILGKTTIDSQEDIDSIKKKADEVKKTAETKKQVDDANKNREALGFKLVDLIKKGGNFYALHKTQVQTWKKTSDGRFVDNKTIIYDKGTKLPTNTNTRYVVVTGGLINLYNGNELTQISPYGFEVR